MADDTQTVKEGTDGASALTAKLGLPHKLKKIEKGTDEHFTLLMCKYNLNFVTGKDRQDLLLWAHDIWNASAMEEREACAKLMSNESLEAVAESYERFSRYSAECAELIRMRPNN